MDPIARGCGIGHALLAKVEAEVEARGGRLLLAETSSTPDYALARRFYETSGFRYEGIVHDFYAPGDDLLIFAKDVGRDDSKRQSGREPEESTRPIEVLGT